MSSHGASSGEYSTLDTTAENVRAHRHVPDILSSGTETRRPPNLSPIQPSRPVHERQIVRSCIGHEEQILSLRDTSSKVTTRREKYGFASSLAS